MISVSEFFRLLRKIDGLVVLEERHGARLDAIQGDLLELDRRVTRLEAREEIVVEQAKAAAAASASTVMMYSVADMARRIGSLEARSQSLLPGRE